MPDSAGIQIRTLSTTREFEEAVRLQRQIWGFDELEILPVRFFVVASGVGGQTFGAFEGERMVGFLLAIPGLKPGGKLYLHSHMTGVLEEYRNRGVGRMLKLRQREDALARGFDLVEWTFDPLELKNAWFNLERLGAVVRRYVLNQYGTTTSHSMPACLRIGASPNGGFAVRVWKRSSAGGPWRARRWKPPSKFRRISPASSGKTRSRPARFNSG
jgi:predicted GNAT superfamily acetyltransferase